MAMSSERASNGQIYNEWPSLVSGLEACVPSSRREPLSARCVTSWRSSSALEICLDAGEEKKFATDTGAGASCSSGMDAAIGTTL